MPEVRNGYIVGVDGYLIPFEEVSGVKLRARDIVVLISACVGLAAALLLGTLFDDRLLFGSVAELAFAVLWINSLADKKCRYPEERIRYRILPAVVIGMLLLSDCFTLFERLGLVSERQLIIFWLCFILFGLLLVIVTMIFVGIVEKLIKKKRCTEEVMATCMGNVRRTVRGGSLYFPVWEYRFGGASFAVKDKSYSHRAEYGDGDLRLIYVNPDDPKDIYRKRSVL